MNNDVVYGLGVLTRFLLALSTYGYIHPDEYIQSVDRMASVIFNWSAELPWEFQSTLPCRSAFPLLIVFGIPFQFLKWIFQNQVRPYYVWLLSRLICFMISISIDRILVMILKRVNTETLLSAHSNRWALRFFAWNYVTFTFLVRPFSNSLETLVLALVTLLSMELLLRRNPLRSSALLLSLLGSTCAFGCFVRMTFPAFGTPLVVLVLWKALRRRHVLKALLWFLVGAALMTIIGVLTDSLYFQSLNWQHIRDLSITLNQLTLTPWNNLRYNMNVDNLSQHGIHARWTHVVVNMPLLYLPLLLILAQVLSTSRQLSFLFRPKGLLFLGPILSGLACLSWMPHQEARFLVPLTFSLHGLLALVFSATQEKFQITRKRWTVFYLMFHITLTLLFGVWHQGGIVPCLLSLTDRSSLDFRTTVYFWKVYNPPLSFLGHPLLRSVDLSTGVTEQLRPGSLLITPRWMESSMPFPAQVEWLETCPRQSSWVHLGLDDAQLFFAAAWKAVTMWDWSLLSLGLYRIS